MAGLLHRRRPFRKGRNHSLDHFAPVRLRMSFLFGRLPVALFSTVRLGLRSCPLSLIITIQLISYNGCKFRKKKAINIGE